MNVYHYGVTNYDRVNGTMGVPLCARVLSGPQAGYLLCRYTTNSYRSFFLDTGDGRGWKWVGDTGFDPAHPHFPFGMDVEPD